jgi:DNA-directed RNA polymerase specialized sigma24 family protein
LRKPTEERAETAAFLALPDSAEDPDVAWEREWRAEHVRFALAEVRRAESAQGRELIDLLLDETLTASEIGLRAGLNANQVYKARSRLVQEVRTVLKRLGEAS